MGKLKESFGNRLQALREKADMTQEEFADEIGLSAEPVSNIERGIYGPKFENLENIAKALHTPVKNLFDFGKEI